MNILFLAPLAAYLFAAVGSVLSFVTKRKNHERTILIVASVGFAAHTVALVVLWWRDGADALFQLHAELSVLAWALCLIYLVAQRRWRAQAFGGFVLPLSALLMLAAALVPDNNRNTNAMLAGDAAANFLAVHTLMLLFAYAAFFVVFAASVMYLLQERELKSKSFGRVFHRLPSLAAIEQINSFAVPAGWLLLTGGIITGMLWSHSIGRGVWHNDPKEILAVLTWLLYTLLLVDRLARLWRGRRAAWIGVMGFALVLCTFFGARLLGGYHVFN